MHKSVEPLSDHPLFRALVLMGGALSVGCGGVAQREAPGVSEVSDGGSANGATAGANSVGGDDDSIGWAGMATQTSTNAAAFYDPTCPYEQWDCGEVSASTCYFTLKSKDDHLAAGCKCDTARPTSASACKADEQFVCRQAYPPYAATQPEPATWDSSLHIQCACVLAPVPASPNCDATCIQAFGDFDGARTTQCYLPSGYTCSEDGVCTATSADVLRQDGIMCGCSTIALK